LFNLQNRRTGTEEQTSERGELLNTVIAVLAQSIEPINLEFGAEADQPSWADDDDIFLEQEVADAGMELKVPNSRKKKVQEKVAADKERDAICAAAAGEKFQFLLCFIFTF